MADLKSRSKPEGDWALILPARTDTISQIFAESEFLIRKDSIRRFIVLGYS